MTFVMRTALDHKIAELNSKLIVLSSLLMLSVCLMRVVRDHDSVKLLKRLSLCDHTTPRK